MDANEKVCTQCRETKPLTEFTKDKSQKSGIKSYCRACQTLRQRKWWHTSKTRAARLDQKRIESRNQRAKLRAAGMCVNCYAKHDGSRGQRCTQCAKLHCALVAGVRERARRECLEYYGACYCACCGEIEYRFLTLDHKENNGAHERRTIHSTNGGIIYAYLKRRGFPPGYQVLCYNCNCGRALNGGICPHKQQRK